MLNKRNLYSVFIIVLFFIIASITTFRIAIYAFLICYVGVIIAKSRNRRLRVPVLDFFALTSVFGIILCFIYSFSPKTQYYEFVLMHSRWEVYQVERIENQTHSEINLFSNFNIGTKNHVNLIYFKDNEQKQINFVKYLYEDDFLKIINQTSNLPQKLLKETSEIQNASKLTIFKKPDKDKYHVFNKANLIENSYSLSNFIFSCFFLLVFIFTLLFLFFNIRRVISTILNQFPKQDLKIYLLILVYIVIYLGAYFI